MATRVLAQDKYTLRDIHREIDLLDRKLLHLVKHEVFETEELRDAAVRKAANKRELLTGQAKSLIAIGIEYLPSDVPRSLRTGDEIIASAPTDTEATPQAAAEAVIASTPDAPSDFGKQVARLQNQIDPTASPLAAWQDDLAAYKKRRQRVSA